MRAVPRLQLLVLVVRIRSEEEEKEEEEEGGNCPAMRLSGLRGAVKRLV